MENICLTKDETKWVRMAVMRYIEYEKRDKEIVLASSQFSDDYKEDFTNMMNNKLSALASAHDKLLEIG